MSFDVFVQAFDGGEAGQADAQAIAAVLGPVELRADAVVLQTGGELLALIEGSP